MKKANSEALGGFLRYALYLAIGAGVASTAMEICTYFGMSETRAEHAVIAGSFFAFIAPLTTIVDTSVNSLHKRVDELMIVLGEISAKLGDGYRF